MSRTRAAIWDVEAGDIIGEEALEDHANYTRTVWARTEMRMMNLLGEDLRRLARKYPAARTAHPQRSSVVKKVGSFCCPALPGPRLPIRQRGPFHYRWHLYDSPITAEPYRAKEPPLHVRRSCFAPTEYPPRERAYGGGAGYRPRVRAAYYEAVYRHSPVARTPPI